MIMAMFTDILINNQASKQERVEFLLDNGLPAYITSVGWIGFSEEKVKNVRLAGCNIFPVVNFSNFALQLCGEALKQGWRRRAFLDCNYAIFVTEF
uniref:Uncharacterized protein n=1 Tax=Romanomermis culicivorax TaxID=13658 RepID=A0A915K4A6_ROMCU